MGGGGESLCKQGVACHSRRNGRSDGRTQGLFQCLNCNVFRFVYFPMLGVTLDAVSPPSPPCKGQCAPEKVCWRWFLVFRFGCVIVSVLNVLDLFVASKKGDMLAIVCVLLVLLR